MYVYSTCSCQWEALKEQKGVSIGVHGNSSGSGAIYIYTSLDIDTSNTHSGLTKNK